MINTSHFIAELKYNRTEKGGLINTLQEENKQLTTQVVTLKEVLQTKT
jgi:hypothetical protein